MKFVHIADMHFDSPFVNLSDRETLGDLRRIEQRKVFKKVIDYIKKEEIPYLFISGDLYEQKYVKQSTIEYINNLFKEIPNTHIYISPGNHDPYIKNSYYNKFEWAENVKIFQSKIEKIELDDVVIYGYGFDDFYCTDCGIENVEISNKEKLNILVMHATLDGASLEEKQYNSVSNKTFKEKGFDYVALGHIHKTNYDGSNTQNVLYSGSTVSLGFDEIGKHGMIVGEISKTQRDIKFIEIDESEFVEKQIDVTEILSKEELVEKMNEIKIEENEFVKIILIGKRNFEIDTLELYKLMTNERIIKVRDKTKIKYDLEKIANENTLRGLFAIEMIEQLKKQNLTDQEKSNIEKAIEIGFEALE